MLSLSDQDEEVDSEGDQTDTDSFYRGKNTFHCPQCNSYFTTTSTTTTATPVDPKSLSYPFCIVFIPFPIISWLLPLLGHYGIGMSDGTVRDFSRNYEIGVNTISFGTPTKYCKLNPAFAKGGIAGWDRGINIATKRYLRQWNKPLSYSSKKNPSYVAESLNEMEYEGKKWNRLTIWFLMLYRSHYTSVSGVGRTWLPFGLIVTTCALLLYIMDRMAPSSLSH